MEETFPVPDSAFQQQIKENLPDVLCSLNGNGDIDISFKETTPPLFENPEVLVDLAVNVNNVCKTYAKGARILDSFSMKVPTGAIYSLLGSSGCGKTTILSCIVGLKKWDSGDVSVLGLNQGNCSKKYMEIASRVGYMPQELALYDHLTTKEIIQYYGKLYGLSDEEIDVTWRTLAKLLELSSKRFVQIKELSGGQKRRVSLLLALIHKPQLLVLDEPTVGLDPLLRKRIWEHLHELVITHKTTVLITTHYVEETKFSNVIGVMRNGRMLIEDSPHSILSTYKSDLIQDSILQICREDHEEQMLHNNNNKTSSTESIPSASTTSTEMSNEVEFRFGGKVSPRSSIDLPDIKCYKDKVQFCGFKERDPDEIGNGSQNDNGKGSLLDIESSCHYYGTRYERFKKFIQQSALRTISFSYIMWIYLMRQPIFLFILLFIPAVQLFMTFYVVGREPTDLKVGVINLESLALSSSYPGQDICQNASLTEKTCDMKLLSCHIQNLLSKTGKINLVQLTTKEGAEELIQQGTIFGYVKFPRNYSESLINRFMLGRFTTDNDTFEDSKIIITLDKSHYLAYHVILKEIVDAMEQVSTNLEVKCGFDQRNNEIPFRYRKPVFGKLQGTHQESIMPAIVAQILFEILYGIAPMILIKDLKQGTFARSNLAGLRFSEFMMGVFVTMGPILLLQSISCYMVLQYGFGFEVKGSFLLFIVLCLVAGLCGQGFGIFVGILVKSEFAVIVSAIMVVPIIMTCSGTLWPLESHPGYLMVTYYVFPSALIVSSLRSVVNRGVGITHALVWPGLANSIIWSVIFWLLSIYGFKRMAKA